MPPARLDGACGGGCSSVSSVAWMACWWRGALEWIRGVPGTCQAGGIGGASSSPTQVHACEGAWLSCPAIMIASKAELAAGAGALSLDPWTPRARARHAADSRRGRHACGQSKLAPASCLAHRSTHPPRLPPRPPANPMVHVPDSGSDSDGAEGSKRNGRMLIDAAAGAIAGCIARFLTGPLDVIKIRFQVQLEPIHGSGQEQHAVSLRSKYTGFTQAFGTILKEEGVQVCAVRSCALLRPLLGRGARQPHGRAGFGAAWAAADGAIRAYLGCLRGGPFGDARLGLPTTHGCGAACSTAMCCARRGGADRPSTSPAPPGASTRPPCSLGPHARRRYPCRACGGVRSRVCSSPCRTQRCSLWRCSKCGRPRRRTGSQVGLAGCCWNSGGAQCLPGMERDQRLPLCHALRLPIAR